MFSYTLIHAITNAPRKMGGRWAAVVAAVGRPLGGRWAAVVKHAVLTHGPISPAIFKC